VGATGYRAAMAAVATRPSLWPTAVRVGARLAPRGWWHRPPFLPRPDRRYLAFRATTQYGDPDHPLEPGDVVQYLRWCRSMRASS
jgi:hypothetical protein